MQNGAATFLPFQMSKLIFLRHGISYTNEGRYVDKEQQNLLSRTGIHQALMNAEEFRVANPDLHFDHAFISTYQRAIQTGLNFLSTFENKPIDVEYVHDIRERGYGFERFIGIKELIQEHGKHVVDSWDLELDKRPHPDGESLQEVYDRTVGVFNEHVTPRLASGENVLIVAHYFVLKALMSHVAIGNATLMPMFSPRNCTPYMYEYLDGGQYLVQHESPLETFDHYGKI